MSLGNGALQTGVMTGVSGTDSLSALSCKNVESLQKDNFKAKT